MNWNDYSELNSCLNQTTVTLQIKAVWQNDSILMIDDEDIYFFFFFCGLLYYQIANFLTHEEENGAFSYHHYFYFNLKEIFHVFECKTSVTNF